MLDGWEPFCGECICVFLSSSSLFKVSVIGLSVYVVVCHWGGQLDRESWYRIARNFHGLKFSRIGRFWIFAVVSAPRPCPFFASTV